MPDDDDKADLPAFVELHDDLKDVWKRGPIAGRVTDAAKAIAGAEAKLAESQDGCFDFSDGTVQNWSLDQLYGWRHVPTKTPDWEREKLTPFTEYLPYQGFTFGNHQSLGLSADIQKLFVLDPDFKVCEFIFKSPDLSANKAWIGAKGFRIDLHRLYATSWLTIGNQPGQPPSYTAQLRMQVRRPNAQTGQIEDVTLAEYDETAKQFIHHAIDHDKNYRMEFKPPLLAKPQKDVEILDVRVCCRFPGYLGKGMGEFALGGAWLIGNVCPLT